MKHGEMSVGISWNDVRERVMALPNVSHRITHAQLDLVVTAILAGDVKLVQLPPELPPEWAGAWIPVATESIWPQQDV